MALVLQSFDLPGGVEHQYEVAYLNWHVGRVNDLQQFWIEPVPVADEY